MGRRTVRTLSHLLLAAFVVGCATHRLAAAEREQAVADPVRQSGAGHTSAATSAKAAG